MRPREPNADECKDLLEDIRLHFVNDGDPNSTTGVYNEQALHVLAAWLRHKSHFPSRECAYCNKPIGPNPRAIYCRTSCRVMAYQRRQREKQTQTKG